MAPKLPIAAASTGVAAPVKMTPRTTMISSTGASIWRSSASFSISETRSSRASGGPSVGLAADRTAT